MEENPFFHANHFEKLNWKFFFDISKQKIIKNNEQMKTRIEQQIAGLKEQRNSEKKWKKYSLNTFIKRRQFFTLTVMPFAGRKRHHKSKQHATQKYNSSINEGRIVRICAIVKQT